MFLKISVSLVFLCILTAAANAQRTMVDEKLGIINGRAIHLPSPEYPEEAKEFCASGTVSVKVEVDEKGNVTAAEAIAGDELLRAASVEAAEKARFSPTPEVAVKTKGMIVYSFSSENKCVNAGIVNKKALSLAKPVIDAGIKFDRETIIVVNVLIDESGKVVRARTSTDLHPSLRTALENAARQAIFPPTLINGAQVKIKGVIVYKLKPDGTIGF